MFNAFKILLFFSLLTGVIYPLVITGMAQLFFSYEANGSLIKVEDKIIGSELIAQKYTQDIYFWPRPSSSDYVAMPSGATNLSPSSSALAEKVNELRKLHTQSPEEFVPSDLISYSASGLDPHLSPQSIFYQVKRVARARNLSPDKLLELDKIINSLIEKRSLGFLGAKRINVLKLNMAIDAKLGKGV
jgi:K+-transporting ATPase ATPase C chain